MREIAGLAAVAILSCLYAFGQTVSTPSFDVASVRLGDSAAMLRGRSSSSGGPGTDDPGRATFTNISLMGLLFKAYPIDRHQIAGPSWLDTEAYDIAVKIPEGTTKEQYRLMMQNLLAERFHLAIHHEIRELPSYELVIGKRGAKLRETTLVEGGTATPTTSPKTGIRKTDENGFLILDGANMAVRVSSGPKGASAHLTARAQPLSSFVRTLTGQLRAPVVDKTGLTGKYDFTLEFVPEGFTPAGDDAGAPLLTAIQEQLGLRLDAKKVPTDVIVIDKVDKAPTGN